jgi:hypothetical protein
LPLELVTPQKVKHAVQGYTVEVLDRFHVQYREDMRTASVEADFGRTVGISAQSLSGWVCNDEQADEMTKAEKSQVLARIVACLQFMGCTTEVVTE